MKTEASKEEVKVLPTVEKDELVNIATIVNYARYVMQEIQEGFFDAFNPNKKDDICYIAYEFSRYRAFTEIVSRSLYEIEKDLKSIGVTI